MPLRYRVSVSGCFGPGFGGPNPGPNNAETEILDFYKMFLVISTSNSGPYDAETETLSFYDGPSIISSSKLWPIGN